MNINSAVLLK